MIGREVELARLDEALATAGTRHCMVCLHHHPVPMSSRWLDRVGLTNAAEFLHAIDAHRNVRAIVWGHVHQSYDGLRKGVRLLATPGGILRPAAWTMGRLTALTATALILMVGSFVLFAQFSGVPPGSTYVPAHMEGGKFVPGAAR